MTTARKSVLGGSVPPLPSEATPLKLTKTSAPNPASEARKKLIKELSKDLHGSYQFSAEDLAERFLSDQSTLGLLAQLPELQAKVLEEVAGKEKFFDPRKMLWVENNTEFCEILRQTAARLRQQANQKGER